MTPLLASVATVAAVPVPGLPPTTPARARVGPTKHEATLRLGILTPRGTPPAVVEKLNAAIGKRSRARRAAAATASSIRGAMAHWTA